MSTTIDQKVVEMRFDNRQFESNVSTTMSTLDKLKHSLKFTGATKGLEELDAASKKVDFSEIENTAAHAGFSIRDIWMKVASEFEYKVANRIIDAAGRMAKALTIDPVKTGFQEYETQINAIQTILANTESKGTTLADVNGALDELNQYADKTIYNFTEMTRNIGTFTAAGTDLDTSVKAIKGIANLAAVSGSNSQQASTAMYQLSQAMASGTVKLMDWNSVVNAGMGGQVFQDALKDTARVHGVAIDDIIKKNGSFRDSLQEGWLSTEILTDTLSKFTMAAEEGSEEWNTYKKSLMDQGYTEEQAKNILKMANTANDAATKVKTFTQLWETLKEAAQSGWTQTWEILVGDFEESKELLSSISDTVGNFINKMSEARNTLLEDWKVMGGRDDLIESFKNIFDGLLGIIAPIKEAFTDMFPPITATHLVEFTSKLKELTSNLKLTDVGFDAIKRTFKGVFALVKIGVKLLSAAFKIAKPLVKFAFEIVSALLKMTAVIGDWVVGLDEGLERTDALSLAASGIVKVLEALIGVVKKIARFVKDAFVIGPLKAFTAFIDGFKTKFEETGRNVNDLGETIAFAFKSAGAAVENCALVKFFKALWNIVSALAKLIGKVIGTLVGGLVDRLANADFEGIMAFLSTLSLGAIAAGIIKFVKNIKSVVSTFTDFKEAGLGFVKSITGVLDQVRDAIATWQTSIKAEAIMKIAKAVALLVAAIVVLTFVDPDKLSNAVSALALVFGELLIGLNLLTKMQNPITGVTKTSGMMLAMSISVLLLASALKKIADLNPEQITVGLLAVAALMTVLTFTAKKLSTGADQKAIKGILQMVLFAAAIKILAGVCKDLSTLSLPELAKGVGGVTVMVIALAAAARIMGGETKGAVKGSVQMITMATLLVAIGFILVKLGAMSWGSIIRGLAGIAGVMVIMLTALDVMSKIGSKTKTGIQGSAQLIKMSIALLIVGEALKQVGSMGWGAIGRGLVGILGVMTILVGALTIMSLLNNSSAKMGISGPTQLLKMAATLILIGIALKQVGSLSWESIAKGLTGLTAALIVMVGAIAIMSALKGSVAGGAGAIALMALALGLLTPILIALGAMSWESIAKGLVTIAGAFLVIGAAALILSPIIGIVAALAGAVALIGVGILAAGVGLVAFGLGLTAVSAGLIAFAGAVTVAAKALPTIATVITGVVAAIIVGIFDAIISASDKMVEAIGVLIKTLISVLVDNIPVIVDGLLKLIVQLLESLAKYTPQIVSLLADMFIGILTSLAENMGPLTKAIADVANAFVKGIVDALANIDGGNLDEAFLAAGKLGLIMASLAAAAILAPAALIGIGTIVPVIAGLSLALSALGALAQIPGLKWIIGEGGELLQAVGTAIGKFVGGIVGGFMSGVSAQFPQIAKDLSSFMTEIQPFIEGAKKIDTSVVGGVASLVGAMLLVTGASLVERLTSWLTGGNSISKFAEDLVALGEGIKGFSDAVAGVKPEAITAASNAAKALADMTNAIPNSGGIVSWFAGDNSITAFADELPKLGEGLKGFSDKIDGIDPANIAAAANAAKALADMTNYIPNSGGIVSWFSGDNSVAKFSLELIMLGMGLKGFADKISGINPENVTAAANAAKALAEMANCIPNSGGIASWFAGDNSVAKFSVELVTLGMGLKNFSDKVAGINPENMTAASNAAKNLAEMVSYIPSEGGIKAWFTGDTSIAKFSLELIMLGMGLKGFSDKIEGINPENITAAAKAAKNLAEMTSTIPSEGGIKAWFTGESSISKFASKLPKLGAGLKGFSDEVAGINPENVSVASKAAKTLAQMADEAPGDLEPMINFGKKLKPFGEKLKGYFDQTAKITAESITASKNAVDVVKNISGINTGNIEAAAKAITKITKSIKGMVDINAKTTEGFANAVKNIAKLSVDGFIKSFDKLDTQMSKIGKSAVNEFVKAVGEKKDSVTKAGAKVADAFIDGITENEKAATNAGTKLVNAVTRAINKSSTSTYSAGANIAIGLANGISANAPIATSRALTLANSVATIMRKALKINSPSKVGYEIGDFYGLGFINALEDYSSIVYSTSTDMATSAKTGLRDSINKIQKFIDGRIDSQPTIRPVLDLSDVESGAGLIGNMLNGSSVGAMVNAGTISSTFSQNGRGNDDVISAIDKLGKEIGKIKSETYQINGVTYDDGSNIAEAIQAIIRAAKIERRV